MKYNIRRYFYHTYLKLKSHWKLATFVGIILLTLSYFFLEISLFLLFLVFVLIFNIPQKILLLTSIVLIIIYVITSYLLFKNGDVFLSIVLYLLLIFLLQEFMELVIQKRTIIKESYQQEKKNNI